MTWISFLIWITTCIAISGLSWQRGHAYGVADERERVTNLLYAPFRGGHVSQTLRWVLDAVTSGARQLPPKELFFPPDVAVKQPSGEQP